MVAPTATPAAPVAAVPRPGLVNPLTVELPFAPADGRAGAEGEGTEDEGTEGEGTEGRGAEGAGETGAVGRVALPNDGVVGAERVGVLDPNEGVDGRDTPPPPPKEEEDRPEDPRASAVEAVEIAVTTVAAGTEKASVAARTARRMRWDKSKPLFRFERHLAF